VDDRWDFKKDLEDERTNGKMHVTRKRLESLLEDEDEIPKELDKSFK
jgi:hypothetical protein